MEPGIAVIIRALIAGPVLVLAAAVYDQAIGRLDERGDLDGYVSLAVAAGVAGVVLAGLWVIWPLGADARLAVVFVLGLFVPAGVPMILGSIRRHVMARRGDLARSQTQARESLQ